MAALPFGSWQRACLGAAVILGATMLTAAPAAAWTGKVSWTTWLRAGPGIHYTVLDEINGGDLLEVLDCADGWCRTVSGGVVAYIEADLIARAEPADTASVPSTTAPCFESRRSGYQDGEVLRYCAK